MLVTSFIWLSWYFSLRIKHCCCCMSACVCVCRCDCRAAGDARRWRIRGAHTTSQQPAVRRSPRHLEHVQRFSPVTSLWVVFSVKWQVKERLLVWTQHHSFTFWLRFLQIHELSFVINSEYVHKNNMFTRQLLFVETLFSHFFTCFE